MEKAVKRLFYQKLRDFIYHIPGDNPSTFTLCGTNCFVVGQGKDRVMIESGDYPESNKLFLENFNKFMDDFAGIQISKIFITHAHHDHFGGLYDVLKILIERGQEEP
jgi:endoribonuclease LACTB2